MFTPFNLVKGTQGLYCDTELMLRKHARQVLRLSPGFIEMSSIRELVQVFINRGREPEAK